VQALVRYAFEHLKAVRVALVTDAQNQRSRAVAQRCGFALEGILRQERRASDGTLRDTCVYARCARPDTPPDTRTQGATA
jgi:RimJ/RimL family protein N-acetyltransferase